MKQEMISEISLMCGGRTFFDEKDVCYKIPLYQRMFAWGQGGSSKRDNEILQLVQDLVDFDKRLKDNPEALYYLGTLVVKKREDGAYEVIDGQQRLTALYIIFHCLGIAIENKDSLQYESRPWAMSTLRNLDLYVRGETPQAEDAEVEPNIVAGVRAVNQALKAGKGFDEILARTLPRTVLFRTEVPVGTDLNHYFEIMNTRGEQLEPQDIVKAKLMELLPDGKRETFAKVWNACSDMEGYIPMKFALPQRQVLFGSEWNLCPETIAVFEGQGAKMRCATLKDALLCEPVFDDEDEDVDDVESFRDRKSIVHFFSVIDFPHFLLHVLRIYCANGGDVMGGELDDKCMIDEFNLALSERRRGAQQVDPSDFAWGFLECLLRCRFLFDKYVVKRESEDGDERHGTWSLQELKSVPNRKRNGSRSATYVQTQSADGADAETKANIMIQSCLRVSYTSPKAMHWITRLLGWVHDHRSSVSLTELRQMAEGMAADAVRRDFLGAGERFDRLGLATPRIAFNYLDYLLWKRDPQQSFVFEYRNSIEHWYPQHPNPDELDAWTDKVVDADGTEWHERDRFGNLCLLTQSTNSKFSNLPPAAKARSDTHVNDHGSLKYREMIRLTLEIERSVQNDPQKVASSWRQEVCARHEEEMLAILRDAVNDD